MRFHCVKCGRGIESADKAIAVFLFAQTVGMRPRRKSRAQKICFCPECGVSLAFGPPPEGALNVAAYHMIRDLIGCDLAVTTAAWSRLYEHLQAGELQAGELQAPAPIRQLTAAAAS